MNVGDFIRTKDGIDKVAGYRYEPEYENSHVVRLEKNDSGIRYTDKDLPKSRPQIIDLIEKGDYINGSLVNEIKDGKPYHEDYNDPFYSYYFENDDIKTVVTHEQMEAMQYRVEE